MKRRNVHKVAMVVSLQRFQNGYLGIIQPMLLATSPMTLSIMMLMYHMLETKLKEIRRQDEGTSQHTRDYLMETSKQSQTYRLM